MDHRATVGSTAVDATFRPQSVLALLESQANLRPDATALSSTCGIRLTYGELARTARALASELSAAGAATCRRRPRYGIVLPNGARCAAALLGASIAGDAAPFNPALTAPEFEHYFEATAIDALLVGARDAGSAPMVARQMGIPVLRLTDTLTIAGVRSDGRVSAPEPDDFALTLMTSGSTGQPKIVPLTHQNILSSAWDVATSVDLAPHDRCLAMWEQFHIGGLVDLLLAPLVSGGHVVAAGGFDAARFFSLLESERPTWYQSVPTTLNELLLHAERNNIAVKPGSLRFIRSVAAALSPVVMERVEAFFGIPVIRTLGMTEAGPLITTTRLPPAPQKLGSVGRPAGPEVRLFSDDGLEVPQGAPGQIRIRGPNVFGGYEGDPEANKAAFRQGWFLTGDTGYFDADGDLFLTGRAKEMVNRGGEKISPAEVEDALRTHPAVIEAAVVAVPHRTLGEDVAAAVILRSGTSGSDLRAHLQSRLAQFKIPGRIVELADIPKNAVGKIDRIAIARLLAEAETATAAHAAPRTALEGFLTELWARELSVGSVGINQDLAALGGDSLSATRILIAIEARFSAPVPTDVIENLTTVAEVARRLEMAGTTLANGKGNAAGDGKNSAKAAFKRMTPVLDDPGDGAEALTELIEACASKEDLLALADRLTAYEAPADILRFLAEIRVMRVGWRAARPLAFHKAVRLKLRAHRWRRGLEREITVAKGHALWKRAKVSPSVWLYGDPCVPADGKTLLLGFTGNLSRLFVPTYRILVCLDVARYDVLLLWDASQMLFAEGIPEAPGSISALSKHLASFAAVRGYARVVTLGTSGGGLAALYCGLANAADRVVLASPPGLSEHPALAGDLRRLAATDGSSRTPVVIAHGRNERDADPARQIIDLFPRARIAKDIAYSSHNILHDAWKAGKLRSLLSTLLDGP